MLENIYSNRRSKKTNKLGDKRYKKCGEYNIGCLKLKMRIHEQAKGNKQ